MPNYRQILRFQKYYFKITSSLAVINFVRIVLFFFFISFLKAAYLFLIWYPVVFAGYNLFVKCTFEDNLGKFCTLENIQSYQISG